MLLVLIGLVSLLIFLTRRRKRPINFPPGPTSLPIIGNLHQLGTRPFIQFLHMKKTYGDVIAIDFGNYRSIVVNDAKLIREALNMNEFSGRPKLGPFTVRNTNVSGYSGILINEGASWVEHRRFTLRHIRDYGFGKCTMESLIHDEVVELLRTFTKLSGTPIVTKDIFHLAVVNSLWWITAGERFKHSDPKLQTLVRLFTDGMANSPVTGLCFFFPWLSRIAPNLSGFNSFANFQLATKKMVQDRINEERKTFILGQYRHFIDTYIEAVQEEQDPNSFFYGVEGEHNMVNSVTDLFMAGIETTSTALSWSVMLLALHPEIQEKVYQEITTIDGSKQLPRLDQENELPYLAAVINEVLRYSSMVPLSVAHSSTVDVTFHGFHIPKGTMIVPNLYAANKDPEIWIKPDEFIPERFLTSEGQINRETELAVMTFSVGKRGCIGETLSRKQLFLFLSSIFQTFKIVPNPNKPIPKPDYIPSFVLQAKSYEYVFHLRKQ